MPLHWRSAQILVAEVYAATGRWSSQCAENLQHHDLTFYLVHDARDIQRVAF